MNKKTVKKSKQIMILKNQILKSGILPLEIINSAEKLYNDNPYHNFLHALVVTSYVTKLDKNKFLPIELRSLAVGAIFHDTGHTGNAMELDEFISLNDFRTTMDNFPDFIIDDSICRASIIGTVFKNRATNKNRYAKILSDCDIGNIGEGIVEFLYYGSLLALEYNDSIENFFLNTEKKYFLHLLNINKKIFLTEEVREILPNSIKTIKDYYKISLSEKMKMFEELRNKDISLDEFRKKFF